MWDQSNTRQPIIMQVLQVLKKTQKGEYQSNQPWLIISASLTIPAWLDVPGYFMRGIFAGKQDDIQG
jgi:hypothetical protein